MPAEKQTDTVSQLARREAVQRLRRRHADRAGRATIGLILLWLAAFVCAGCARRVPIGELGGSAATVWARVVTRDGEELTGRLISMDASELVIELTYPVEGDVRLSTRLGETELFSGTTRVEGDLIGVSDGEDGRQALVHRRLRTLDIASATFHESQGEQSLRAIVSMLLGPAVGGLAGLVF
jgi:hypothetical protein